MCPCVCKREKEGGGKRELLLCSVLAFFLVGFMRCSFEFTFFGERERRGGREDMKLGVEKTGRDLGGILGR